MTIISFIEDHKVIDKIIAHLKLTFHAERPPPSQIVQKELLMAAEERGEYFWENSWLLFAELRGGVYFEAYFFAFFVVLFLCFILYLIFFLW